MRDLIVILLLLFASPAAASGSFPLNDGEDGGIIGFHSTHIIRDGETLINLARTYNVGYNEIVAANPGVDPWVPDEGTSLRIPTIWLLPDPVEDGIVINLAEMRLYYIFPAGTRRYVRTFPLGIGREGFSTPTGNYRITGKIRDPVWRVPESIRKEDPHLPPFVPPGPENPLGGYWLQLSIKGYGIHGTHRPYGIGRRVSHGCIRLYPEDISILFDAVRPGTRVRIIDEPVKAGVRDGKVFIEVHRAGQSDEEMLSAAAKKLSGKNLLDLVNSQKLIEEIRRSSGLPAVVSEDSSTSSVSFQKP